MSSIAEDPRLDPRLKAVLSAMPPPPETPTFTSRDEILAYAHAPERLAEREMQMAFFDHMDSEELAPSAGLRVERHEFTSHPDGNTVAVNFIRPDDDRVLPCVYWIHGGGMMSGSAFDGNYRAFGKLIAANGVAVAMVDFRNSVYPSSAAEVAPFPAGLNDCESGLRWIADNGELLGIDPSHVVVAGESGGANLALGMTIRLGRTGDTTLLRGVFAMCPYLAGHWPDERFPSSTENNGIVLDLHNDLAKLSYGIEAFEAGDPTAWPSFATEDDVAAFPATMISVNECDPLRDEGLEFYRLLLRAGVPARARTVMGTVHGTEIMVPFCTDISRDTAAAIAQFTRELPEG